MNSLDIAFLTSCAWIIGFQGIVIFRQIEKLGRMMMMVDVRPVAEGEQWSDAPLKSSEGDQFGRTSYAHSIAKTISETYSSEESVVYGIVGPWGIGKSSTLVMVEQSLKAIEGDRRLIVHFNPWVTSDIDGLLSEFYTSLFSEVLSDDPQKWKKIVVPLLRITSSGLKQFNYLGAPLAVAIGIGADRISKPMPWNDAFEKASAAIRRKNKKILVVADDIDRLQSDELRAFLKVIRLLGRFPGVQYLLAYDQESVADALQQDRIASDRTSALKFMEKIVQYPFNVPPLLDWQILKRIDAGIEEALTHSKRSLEGLEIIRRNCSSSGSDELKKVFASRTPTPRSIDRFISQLKTLFSVVPKAEVCDADLIVLTLLWTHYPKLYQDLPSWKKVLCGGDAGADSRKVCWSNLLGNLGEDQREGARVILEWLFPAMQEVMQDKSDALIVNYVQDWQASHVKRRISMSNYFDRYFVLGVPEYDVSDARLKLALDKLGSEEGKRDFENFLFRSDLDEQSLEERVQLTLQKLEEYCRELENSSRSEWQSASDLFCALFPLLAKMPGENLWWGSRASARNFLHRVVVHLHEGLEWDGILKVLSKEGNLFDALYLVSDLQRYFKGKEDESPARWNEVVEEFCGKVAGYAFSYFSGGCNFSRMDEMQAAVWFLKRNNKSGLLCDKIQSCTDVFSVAEFAALFVKVDESGVESPSSEPKIKQFELDAFNEFIPSSLSKKIHYDNPSGEDIDLLNLTWENRVKFAKENLMSA